MRKKRFISLLLCLSLLLALPNPGFAQEEKQTYDYFYLEEDTDMYETKDLASKPIYRLGKKTVIKATLDGDWLTDANNLGYIKSGDSLVKLKKVKLILIEDSPLILISSDSDLTDGLIERGSQLYAYTADGQDWYYLEEQNGLDGFIAKKSAIVLEEELPKEDKEEDSPIDPEEDKDLEEKPEIKPEEKPSLEGYVNAKNKLNVRNAPNGDKIIGSLKRNTYVKGELIGAWVKIDFEGQTGYIHRSYLSKDKLVDSIEGYVNAKNKLNVRNAPNGDKIIGSLKRNTYVKGEFIGYWVKIDFEGQTGYIHKSYLSKDKLDETMEGYINAKNKLNVRDNPVNGKIVGSLSRGKKVKGTLEDGWIKIKYNNNDAYIHSSFVQKEDVITKLKGFVKAPVNMRKEASSNAPSLGYLAKGTYLKGEVTNDSSWLKVELDGKTFYIAKNFLVTKPVKADFFTKSQINIRKGPGLKYETYGKLAKGAYLEGEYLENGQWVKFSNYGNTVYVSANLLEHAEANSNGWIKKGYFNYYLNKGVPARGWKTIKGQKYYFDPMMRYRYSGLKNTGEGVYYFNSNGSLRTGSITVPGSYYNHTYNLAGPRQSELANGWLREDERHFLGQKALNIALEGSGTKYLWYGIDLKNGVYCSGVPYAAYKQVGITIPGPEYGNLADAKKHGQQSGPPIYGYGSAGEYGYMMASNQYTQGHKYTGSRLYFNGNFNNIKAGDVIFAKNPSLSNKVVASHSMIYAGMNNGRPMIIHSGFVQGNILDNITMVTHGWGYRLMPYAHRPYK